MNDASDLLKDTPPAEPENPIPADERENDNVSRAMFFNSLLSPEDCARVLELPEDQALTQQFMSQQRQLMPGFENYMRCESRVLAVTEESAWLRNHLHTILSAVNSKHYDFEADKLMGTQILSFENGQHLDWHSSLGGGFFAQRKLMLLAFLSPMDAFIGGEFEIMASPFATMRREQGMVATFPAFSVCRIRPVTSGRMHILVGWLHGPGQFS